MNECTNSKQYLIEFGVSMAAYVVAILGTSFYLKANPDTVQWARIVLALLPVGPCILAAVAIIRQFRRMDELQQRVQFEAMTYSFVLTCLGTFAWGLLEEKAGFPRLPILMLLPAMMVLYGLGQFVAARRYR